MEQKTKHFCIILFERNEEHNDLVKCNINLIRTQ